MNDDNFSNNTGRSTLKPEKEFRPMRRIKYILNPQKGGVEFPHLHEIYLDRLPEVREDGLSRCTHGYDTENYQTRIKVGRSKTKKSRLDDSFDSMCDDVKDRFRIYGHLGSGTFGTIFAAHKRTDGSTSGEFEHYALKVARHHTWVEETRKKALPHMVRWPNTDEKRYIPDEAIFMLFLGQSERFPQLDSVYTHEHYFTIVMSSGLDGEALHRVPSSNYTDRFEATIGIKMIHEKGYFLYEVEVCKVVSQLLEAMIYLRDLGIVHDDLSHLNYIIKENLDTELIDFGNIKVGFTDQDMERKMWYTNLYQIYQISPELAIELAKDHWRPIWKADLDTGEGFGVDLVHDARVEDQWKFAVITFELLHGYAPWENPQWDPRLGDIRDWRDPDECMEIELNRQERMINEEIQIYEDLSQDCVDVLHALLARDPTMRPDVSMQELASFPWFQGYYVDYEPFQRPTPDYSSEFS